MNPALVLIHGYPFDHTMWDHVVALLDPNIQVLAPDLAGFGGSPPHPEPPSLNWMAKDIADLLDQHDIAWAVMAGMSMGGYVALAFAEQDKERLAGLALVSSQAAADTDETRRTRRNMIETIRREGSAAAAQAAMPKFFAPGNGEKPELVRFPLQGAEKAGIEGLTWALEAMATRPDRTTLLQNLKAPLLLAHGAQDQFIPVERARQLAQSIPGTAFIEIPDAGHCTPIEAPDKVAKALEDFWKSCCDQPGK